MQAYSKLFTSILDSTIWSESVTTKIMWVTMLAMTDSAGCVFASVPGLAKRAGVSISEGETALKCFLSPDPYSRTKEHEGRRIKEIDGGWQLLNYDKYSQAKSREHRNEYQRLQMRARREKAKAKQEAANAYRDELEARREGDPAKAAKQRALHSVSPS
jgi:hypothetical protein